MRTSKLLVIRATRRLTKTVKSKPCPSPDQGGLRNVLSGEPPSHTALSATAQTPLFVDL